MAVSGGGPLSSTPSSVEDVTVCTCSEDLVRGLLEKGSEARDLDGREGEVDADVDVESVEEGCGPVEG